MTLSLAGMSGWAALGLFVGAAAVPLAYRARLGRRAVAGGRALRGHAAVGLGAAVMALLHTLCVVPSMGSPAAIAGGTAAMAPGALAFFLLFAHIGVGSKLLDRKLRDRTKQRRLHVRIATAIAACIAVHVVVLMR